MVFHTGKQFVTQEISLDATRRINGICAGRVVTIA